MRSWRRGDLPPADVLCVRCCRLQETLLKTCVFVAGFVRRMSFFLLLSLSLVDSFEQAGLGTVQISERFDWISFNVGCGPVTSCSRVSCPGLRFWDPLQAVTGQPRIWAACFMFADLCSFMASLARVVVHCIYVGRGETDSQCVRVACVSYTE